jgi:hypothetical protein
MGGGFILHVFVAGAFKQPGHPSPSHVRCRKIYNLETGSFFWCVSQRVQINYIYICIPTVQVYCVNPAMSRRQEQVPK